MQGLVFTVRLVSAPASYCNGIWLKLKFHQRPKSRVLIRVLSSSFILYLLSYFLANFIRLFMWLSFLSVDTILIGRYKSIYLRNGIINKNSNLILIKLHLYLAHHNSLLYINYQKRILGFIALKGLPAFWY